MMKNKIIIGLGTIVFLFFPAVSFAGIDPIQKECLQRGYQVSGEICVFPNGTSCLLEKFNDKSCGLEFRKEAYCVPKGGYVWDEKKCCPGLKSFLKKNEKQLTCESKTELFFKNPFTISVGLLLVIGGAGTVLYFLKKKRQKSRINLKSDEKHKE